MRPGFLSLRRRAGGAFAVPGTSGAALAGGLEEHHGTGGGNIERGHLAGHGNAQQVIAGAADQIVQARAFASEDDYGIGRKVVAVVILRAALVEPDDPEVVLFQGFEGANQIDHAGEAEVLGGSGRGLEGGGGERRGAALSEEDAIDAGGFGGAKQRAEVLRVFYAVERENEAGFCTGQQVLNVEEVALANDSDDALVGGGSGETGEGIAGLGAGFHSGGAAEGGDGAEPRILAASEALLGEADVIETAGAGAEGLLDGMEAIEDFHQSLV